MTTASSWPERLPEDLHPAYCRTTTVGRNPYPLHRTEPRRSSGPPTGRVGFTNYGACLILLQLEVERAGGPMAQPFHIRTGRDGVLQLSGEVDLSVVPKLLASVDGDRERSELVVDLSAVTFIDSSGILAIIELGRKVGGRTLLRGPQGSVQRVLDLVGLDDHEGIRIE